MGTVGPEGPAVSLVELRIAAEASPNRTPEWRASPGSPGTFSAPA